MQICLWDRNPCDPSTTTKRSISMHRYIDVYLYTYFENPNRKMLTRRSLQWWCSEHSGSEGCSRVDGGGAGGERLENKMNGSREGKDADYGSRLDSLPCDHGLGRLILACVEKTTRAWGCWYLPVICSSAKLLTVRAAWINCEGDLFPPLVIIYVGYILCLYEVGFLFGVSFTVRKIGDNNTFELPLWF